MDHHSIGIMSSTLSQHVHSLGRLYLKNEHGLVQVSMEGSKVTLLMCFVSKHKHAMNYCKLSLYSAKGEDDFSMSSAGISCYSFQPIDLINNQRQVNDNSRPYFTSVPAALFSSLAHKSGPLYQRTRTRSLRDWMT